MEIKKILLFSTFFPPYHLGGDATHVEYLGKMLAKLGHEVHVVHLLDSYYFKKGRVGENSSTSNDENGIMVHSLKSPYNLLSILKAYSLGESRYYNKECEKIVNNIKPEIVHHHNIAGFGPSVLKFKAKDKKIYTAHDYWLICQNSGLVRPNKSVCSTANNCIRCQFYSKRPNQIWRCGNKFNKIISTIDTIISPSLFMQQKLLDFNIINNIQIINNFAPDPIKIFNSGLSRKHLLFVGLLDDHKGITWLVENFKLLYEEFEIPLHIVGSGPLEKRLTDYVKKHNMENKVTFKGRLYGRDLAYEYSNAIATIVPSICPENNPLVAIESLSYGTPVIGSSNGGIPEIVSKLDENLVFHDANGLFKSVNFILENKALNDTALKIFDRQYSERAYLLKYDQLLRS